MFCYSRVKLDTNFIQNLVAEDFSRTEAESFYLLFGMTRYFLLLKGRFLRNGKGSFDSYVSYLGKKRVYWIRENNSFCFHCYSGIIQIFAES